MKSVGFGRKDLLECGLNLLAVAVMSYAIVHLDAPTESKASAPPTTTLTLAWDYTNTPNPDFFRLYRGNLPGIYTESYGLPGTCRTGTIVAPLTALSYIRAVSVNSNLTGESTAESEEILWKPPLLRTNRIIAATVMASPAVSGPWTNAGLPSWVRTNPPGQTFLRLQLNVTNL